MNDMAKLLHPHKVVNFDSRWLTDSVDIITSQINQHDMLCAVLLRRQQLRGEDVIFWIIRVAMSMYPQREGHERAYLPASYLS